MIKIIRYEDLVNKLINYLGVTYDTTEKRTQKNRFSESRSYINKREQYSNKILPLILNSIAKNDKRAQEIIQHILQVVESELIYLNNLNYYTVLPEKQIKVAFFVYLYLPQLVAIWHFFNINHNMLEVLKSSRLFFPIVKNGKIISPMLLLKAYIRNKFVWSGKIENYLQDLKSKRTPRYQTIDSLIRWMRHEGFSSSEVNETEIIFKTSVFMSHVFEDLKKEFNTEELINIINYFNQCISVIEKIDFDKHPSDEHTCFEKLIAYHYELLEYELRCLQLDQSGFLDKNRNQIMERRRSLRYHLSYELLKNYLKFSEPENIGIDINDTNKGMLRYLSRNSELLQFKDKRHESICESIKYIESIFSPKLTHDPRKFIKIKHYFDLLPKQNEANINEIKKIILDYFCCNKDNRHESIYELTNDLNSIFSLQITVDPDHVDQIFNKIEKHPYNEHYKVQILRYKAKNYLAKNQLHDAFETLNETSKQMKLYTAGRTQANNSLDCIILQLIIKPSTSFTHLNPYIKQLIDAQKEELLIFSAEQKDVKDTHESIYKQKILQHASDFNSTGYAHYIDFKCIRCNPFQKLDQFIIDFFENFESNTAQDFTFESKLKLAFNKVTSGRKAKYKVTHSIIPLLGYNAYQSLRYEVLIIAYEFYVKSNFSPSENEVQNIKKMINTKIYEIIPEVMQCQLNCISSHDSYF